VLKDLPLETESVKESVYWKEWIGQKKHCTSKAMSKKERSGLMKFLQCLDPKILASKIQHDALEHFSDGNLAKFASELFENDEPMLEISRYHCKSFVDLYGKCKLLV